jgi:hypothetical protein
VCIERAIRQETAIELAIGYKPVYAKGHWRVKDLGRNKTALQSDRKRRDLLTSPAGWRDL